LRKLQWYGEVNRRGFIKITKKLDKKIESVCLQERYLASKVNPRPFAHNLPLNQDMKGVNEWLSGIGDIKTFDDSGSTHSAASLGRVPGRSLHLPSGLLDLVDQALRGDEADQFGQLLAEASASNGTASSSFQQLLLNLLQRAISCRAKACIDMLLPDIISLEEEDDINKRNCIHRLVINIGRSKSGDAFGSEGATIQSSTEARGFIVPATAPNRQPWPCTSTEEESTKLLGAKDDSVQLLTYLLDRLQSEQRGALQSRDSYGRLPLHYAAEYGFVVICQTVIKHMQDWGQFEVAQGIDSPYWQDTEGFAPLHLSVMGGHALTTKALLEAENWHGTREELLTTRKTISQSGAALALATRSNFVAIVALLVEAGVNVNYEDEVGETALHMAARYGYTECAKVLKRLLHGHRCLLLASTITFLSSSSWWQQGQICNCAIIQVGLPRNMLPFEDTWSSQRDSRSSHRDQARHNKPPQTRGSPGQAHHRNPRSTSVNRRTQTGRTMSYRKYLSLSKHLVIDI
jgi:glycerophosphodiester phosphodiesterase